MLTDYREVPERVQFAGLTSSVMLSVMPNDAYKICELLLRAHHKAKMKSDAWD